MHVHGAACIALVDEMNWKISNVDEKSTLQVGSFRIDPNGNQQLRKVRKLSSSKPDFAFALLNHYIPQDFIVSIIFIIEIRNRTVYRIKEIKTI